MLAIVAPGQGAQTPGFLTPWLELPTFAAGLDWFSAVIGRDLAELGTTADTETIKDTAVAQPLLVAAALLTARELAGTDTHELRADLVAGHSVGELAAAALAGVFSPEAAMVLVRERGRSMAQAAAECPTSMVAIVRGEPEVVLAAIQDKGLTAANHNGKGQIVAAGTVEQLQALQDDPPAGARLIPLSVAGAFHTEHMATAIAHLKHLAAGITTHDPNIILLTNSDGSVVTSGRQGLDLIVRQVANPVRWDQCMTTMAERGITGLLELTPSGTLTGISKRNLGGVATFALNTPDQLDEARAFVAEHAGHQAGQEDPR